MIIRTPHIDEVEPLLSLFADEVRAGRMLPRTAENVVRNLDDWLVAVSRGQIAGCVSLVTFSPTLCEVRSLAVHPNFRGNGIASALVDASVDLARMRGMRRVLALTRAPRLFEQLNFRRDAVDNFPEKVWHDCAPCPFKHACDEIALVFIVEGPRA